MSEEMLAANTAEVANPQEPQGIEGTLESTPESTPQTAANNEGTAAPQETQTQAFARRLKEERQRIEQEYTPYRSFVEAEAKKYNMTPQQYIEAVEREQEQAERQQYIDRGIDPDLVNSLLDKHPDIQYAKELKRRQQEEESFRREATELFDMFPDLDAKSIQPEVFQLQRQRGVSLLDAYLRYNWNTAKTQGEQDAIRKLQTNAQTSPGALGGGGEPQKQTVKTMAKKDFEALQMKVLRGEQVDI